MLTVYACLVEGLKPSRGAQPQARVRGKPHKVEFVSAETERKALNKLSGRNPGWQVIYYETVPHP